MRRFLFLTFFIVSACGNPFGSGLSNVDSSHNPGFRNTLNWVTAGANLDLDFASNRYYLNGVTYSGLASFLAGSGGSFSRASTATFFGSNGVLQTASVNSPRFENDPVTLASRGILIEETSTNRFLFSTDLTNVAWTATGGGTISANAGMAPDGTNTAFQFTNPGGSCFLNQGGMPSTASTTITRSYFIKPGTATKVFMEFPDTTNCGAFCVAKFDFAAQTAAWTLVATGQGAVNMLALPNGWYRVSATFSHSAAGGSTPVLYVNGYGAAPAGSLLIWGPQVEAKPFASSYIPTVGVAGVRAADNFVIPTASWFNANVGTFYAQSYGQFNSGQTGYSRILGGDFPMAFLSYDMPNTARGAAVWNGTTSIWASSTVTYPNLTSPGKAAFTWDAMSSTASVAAGISVTAAAYGGNWNSVNIYPGGSNYNTLNAGLLRATYLPYRASDAALLGMTQ